MVNSYTVGIYCGDPGSRCHVTDVVIDQQVGAESSDSFNNSIELSLKLRSTQVVDSNPSTATYAGKRMQKKEIRK